MPSIFSPSDNTAFVQRIQSLSPESKAQWGKMDVAQMLAHCCQPIRVAQGDLKLKRGLIGFLFGNMARKQLLSDETPFKPNSPTAREFRITDARVFETEKARLIPMVERFSREGTSVLIQGPHPFFGQLSIAEWDLLMCKHLDHHLRQFGA